MYWRPPGPGETLPPFPPAHSIIPAYKFAWPVGMDHADDLPCWYQFYLKCHSAVWSQPAGRRNCPACHWLTLGWPVGSASTPAPGDVAGPASQDTAGAVQVTRGADASTHEGPWVPGQRLGDNPRPQLLSQQVLGRASQAALSDQLECGITIPLTRGTAFHKAERILYVALLLKSLQLGRL